jgi:serine phosphatase RsbU (regulator of sigma subunit)/CHASE2 domain-containing sensor protein
MATASLQKRITLYSAICGSILALAVVICDAAGVLQPLEWWLYDLRAATCQFSSTPPSKEVVHILIDDDAIEAIGAWPWRRSIVGELLDEMRLAGPKVVALDVLFTDPQNDSVQKDAFGEYRTIAEDQAMVRAVAELGCVVLPLSFQVRASTDVDLPPQVHAAAVGELERDPWQEPAQFAERMGNTSGKQLGPQIVLHYPDLIREALFRWVRARLQQRAAPAERLWRELALPITAPATSPMTQPLPAQATRLKSVFDNAYQRARAELAVRRFAAAVPGKLPVAPPEVRIKLAPLAELSDAAAGCGFADYDFFHEPTVRAVPLFGRVGDRLYPQFGLAIACRILGVDIADVRIERDVAIIPTQPEPIRIPLRIRRSSNDRAIGTIMDIPFFGTAQWQTMYDWPDHQKVERHYSINVVGEIVTARAKLASNNVTIDKALIEALLPTRIRAEEYARNLPPADDFASRRDLVQPILSTIEKDYPPEVIQQDRKLSAAIDGAKNALRENETLLERIDRRRQELSALIGGKAVLVGWVATGTLDQVPTSLHSRCPGVVVHGVIVNAILNRDFLRTAPRWATILLTLLFGLLATAITSRLPPARAVLMLLLIAACYFAINGLVLFDRLKLIVNAAAPLVAIGICWGGCLVVRTVVETLERIRLNREAAVLDHEINLARQVQAALIPKQLAILTKVESHGWTLAATTTGGDCFDLWKLADGRLGILVADASGHGLGPSIIVSEVRALVRALCDLYSEPQKLIERVNQRLAQDLQGTKFCTAFVGFLSEDGALSWGSAGHGPMLCAATADEPPRELEGTALPLGVSEEWLGDESVPPIQLQPGGWLAVVSDGIFEQPNPKGEQFGVERLRAAIDSMRTASCEAIVDAVRTAVHRWQVVTEPGDDQTIVFVRVLGAGVTDGNGGGAKTDAAALDVVSSPAT